MDRAQKAESIEELRGVFADSGAVIESATTNPDNVTVPLLVTTNEYDTD